MSVPLLVALLKSLNMTLFIRLFIPLLRISLFIMVPQIAAAQGVDIAGSDDIAFIKRFAGSYISHYLSHGQAPF